uniref:hypothetical protein n=1 Tax=Hominenteromicrobium sp. TaxID=3073581 RepID=UPI003A8D6E25
ASLFLLFFKFHAYLEETKTNFIRHIELKKIQINCEILSEDSPIYFFSPPRPASDQFEIEFKLIGGYSIVKRA